jgi:hypothetical protein
MDSPYQRNKHGGFFQHGKKLDSVTVHRILDHYFQQSDVQTRSLQNTAHAIGVHHDTVKKYVVRAYLPWKDRRTYSHPRSQLRAQIITFIDYLTIQDHTLTHIEIKQLLWEGMNVRLDESTISRIRKHVLGFRRKRINLVDQRRLSPANQLHRFDFKKAAR